MAKKRVDVIIGAKNMTARALRNATRAFKRFGRSVTKIMKRSAIAVTAFGATVFGLTVMFLKAASAAEETRTKFEAVFSSIREEAESAAQALARDFGLAASSARELLGDTGDLLVGFGFTERAALELSDKMNRLAIDLASFTNYSKGAKGASQALTKLLLGETEQAKSLGIVVRQGSDAYKNSVAQKQKDLKVSLLQAKALTALEMATAQSGKAMGDYARTSGGLANTMRRLSESWKLFREEVGLSLNRSGAFNRLLEEAEGRLSAFREQLVGIIDAMSVKGQRGRVVTSVGNVILAALKLGGERIAHSLKSAAPEIGRLIGDGIKAVAKRTPLAREATRVGTASTARGVVRGQMRRENGPGWRPSMDFKEFDSRVKAMTEQLLEQAGVGKKYVASMKGVITAEQGLKAAQEDHANLLGALKLSMPAVAPKTGTTATTTTTPISVMPQAGSTSTLSMGQLFESIYSPEAKEKAAHETAMIKLLETIADNTGEAGLE